MNRAAGISRTPDTQRAAYASLNPELAGRRRDVFRAIALAGRYGRALFEVSLTLNIPVHCVSGRITELADAGLIVDSGARRRNPYTHKSVIVWVATSVTCDPGGQMRFVE
jgi:hypothetical protein